MKIVSIYIYMIYRLYIFVQNLERKWSSIFFFIIQTTIENLNIIKKNINCYYYLHQIIPVLPRCLNYLIQKKNLKHFWKHFLI